MIRTFLFIVYVAISSASPALFYAAHAADITLESPPPPPAAAQANVIHISSYDNSYSWNYNIVQEIHTIMNEKGINVQSFYLDSHHLTPPQLIERGKEFRDIILAQKPDVIIATDDAAAQYVIQPYFLDNKIPVVFAGINWDASEYDLPASNTTGMIEINPTKELFNTMNRIVGKDMSTVKIAFVGPDTFSQHKNLYFETRLTGKAYSEIYLVKTYTELKNIFAKAQQNADYVYFGNIAAVE